jgi:phage baseplate assembly protein W
MKMDSSQLIGTGIPFPIRINPTGGINWSSGPQRIQDSIWIILSTSPGERVMRPTFGAGVKDYVFEPNSPTMQARLASAIKNALSQWEPRIDVDDVTVTQDANQPNHVLASIQYRIRATNELFNMVYPLYLQEGLG